MAPRALGLGATQIVFVVMTGLASGLAIGSISAFNYAFALLQIPIGVIGVPLATVLLPSLSREAALGGTEAFRRLLVGGLGMLAWVMIAITALGIVVAWDVVRVLYGFAHLGPAGPRLDRGQPRGVHGRPHGALADRRPGAGLLRAARTRRRPVVAALVAVAVNIVVGDRCSSGRSA